MICPAKFPDEECDEPACLQDGCIINALCNDSKAPFIKTTLRKICPNSGQQCDCPKGVCQGLSIISNAAQDTSHGVSILEENVVIVDSLSTASIEIAGRPCPATPDNELCPAPICAEACQADSLEAHSIKYQACAQITMLRSGKFALFGAYHSGGGSGIELIAIGDWASLEEHVRNYRALADDAYQRGQTRTLPAKIAADYENLFGDDEDNQGGNDQ